MRYTMKKIWKLIRFDILKSRDAVQARYSDHFLMEYRRGCYVQ